MTQPTTPRLSPPTTKNPSLAIIPFVSGRRPCDEVNDAGQGCSEGVGFLRTISAADDPALKDDEIYILYQLRGADAVAAAGRLVQVRLSAWFLTEKGKKTPCPLPDLCSVQVPLQTVAQGIRPALKPASLADAGPYVATLVATRDLRTADGSDAFSLAHLFHRRVQVELALWVDGALVSRSSTVIEIFHTGRLGSLYARLLERLLPADIASQAAHSGISGLLLQHHPFFPVLSIGSEKARLYLHAIHQDLDQQQHNLPDPSWLLRVGLYLELLTCLGLFEAVKDEHPDLLSAEERALLLHSPTFAAIRRRLSVKAWRKVWQLRAIAPGTYWMLAAGPVSILNLRYKQKATLAFLHAHHEDLKRAIELAGPNRDSSQATWHRVFRDAERAVAHTGLEAFPELRVLGPNQRNFVLWHQLGELRLFGRYAIPSTVSAWFGDQDGLYAAASRQYRRSMNDVAKWARRRGLMDYSGSECVPGSASLVEARLAGADEWRRALDRRDGYAAAA